MLVIGLDVHKDSLAAVAVDHAGRQVGCGTFDNTDDGHRLLLAWANTHGVRLRIGMEPSGGVARQLAHSLETAGHVVAEVQPRLSRGEAKRLRTRGKTDPSDALAIARVVLREPNLPPVRQAGVSEDLKLLVDYRDQLFNERTRIANRLHADMAIAYPGYQRTLGRVLTSRRALLAAQALIEDDQSCRADLSRRRIERLLALDTESKALQRQIAHLVRQSDTTLMDVCGIGPIVAARILGEVGDVRRFPTEATFAATNGTAPIAASSGRTERHRLNRGGNRRLNYALYVIAITQTRHEPRAAAYLAKRRAEGKTRREALRSLKRHLSNVVYRRLMADAQKTLDT
jgi:transposase